MASTYDIASRNALGILNGNSSYPSISADGTLVAFQSFVAGPNINQVFVKDESTSALTQISQSSGGTSGNASSLEPTISADGTAVAFESSSTNLVAGVTGGNDEIYVKNVQTGGLQVASQTAAGVVANGSSDYPTISANGTLVAFDSSATNLGLGGTGTQFYVKSLVTGALTLVSETANGTISNGTGFVDGMSPDGNFVLFETNATDLGSSSGQTQIYVKNVATGALALASTDSSGNPGNAGSFDGAVSSDGLTAFFNSSSTNLVAGATSGASEVYMKNLQTGAISLVSQKADGTIANGSSSLPIVSADGKYVLFQSSATNLDPAATTGTTQLYVKNLQTGALSLVTKDGTGAAGNNSSLSNFANTQVFSADDTKIVFSTNATNLAGTPAGTTVVLRDATSGPALTLNPVTSDDIVNATEAPAAGFSGTSDAIGGTVQVALDAASNVIGSATVAADGTWSLTANVSGLSQGAHTEIATVQGSSYLPTSSSQGFTVDTVAPTTAFSPGITFNHAGKATISGTVTDPSSAITKVEIFNGTTDLGPATIIGNTWTIKNVTLPPGVQALGAQATDAAGNVSAIIPSANFLETGIKGAPWTRYEADFDSAGNLIGEIFTKQGGRTYLSDTVTNLPNGNHDIFSIGGAFFDNQDYYAKDDLYGPQYGLKVESLFNDDGTTTITAFQNGQTLNSFSNDTMTGGGSHETFKFTAGFGQDLITDFMATGTGHDTISLSSHRFSSVAQVLAHTQDVNGNAVIDVGQSTITVQNVTKETLAAHKKDFSFHA